ncbi:MAG: ABC transporter permease [SAR202 cluster bacterium]|nr:ABC transporter permease [SAR202 cluster bacterium]
MSDRSQNQRDVLRSHLSFFDLVRVGGSGLKTRKLRSALSATGIMIGIAALVGVLGLSSSGSADLIKELDALGTNLLRVEAGGGFRNSPTSLPADAVFMIERITPVYEVATVSSIPGAVYRNDLISDGRTQGISIKATDLNLLATQRGSLQAGVYLDDVLAQFPAVVLGSVAAQRLEISELLTPKQIWLGNNWFRVVGILNPLPLAADLDRAALIGYGIAEDLFDYDGIAEVIYVRADPNHILDVREVMAATVNPEFPEEVQVSRTSDVLEARAATRNTFTNLFVGLGAVALLVGAIGIANVMVIAVIERRNEIGLRRALGATRFHVGAQFLIEALVLSGIGGLAGIVLGLIITAVYATFREWSILIPEYAVFGGMLGSLVIGGIAGLYPALRAANMSPTEALRTS